ncbi:hypothetical protein KCP78_12235 [Salmonella enterica subsp. enterica]|nr:hypothetical protein KCP78_12235 [Salmonella enterica subsp. enterica]
MEDNFSIYINNKLMITRIRANKGCRKVIGDLNPYLLCFNSTIDDYRVMYIASSI